MKMRWVLTLITMALAGGCIVACGEAGKAASSASNTPSSSTHAVSPGAQTTVASAGEPKPDGDNDYDSSGKSLYDKDDAEIVRYGVEASPGDRQQVATLVKRYYAAATSANGAAGCTVLYSLIAESIAEEDGEKPGLEGKTCPEVMSKLFKQDQERSTASAKLHITGMRVSGDRGLVLLGTGTKSEDSQLIHREAGAWKIVALVSEGLP